MALYAYNRKGSREIIRVEVQGGEVEGLEGQHLVPGGRP